MGEVRRQMTRPDVYSLRACRAGVDASRHRPSRVAAGDKPAAGRRLPGIIMRVWRRGGGAPVSLFC